MIPRIISPVALKEWVNQLTTQFSVYAPVQNKGDYDYTKITSSDQIAFDFDRTRMSLKGFFLKPEEKLMSTSASKGGSIAPAIDAKKRVVFGARPCDITALNLTDDVFVSDFHDPYYMTRRNSTLIVGIRCTEKCRTCFCGTMDSHNPLTGYDIMLTELETGEFLIQGGSIEGERVIRQSKQLSRESSESDRSSILKTFKNITETFTPEVPTMGLKAIIDLGHTQLLWEKYQETCLSCGQCVFVCPTCWCFDVKEQVGADPTDFGNIDKTTRIRRWASCLYQDYHTVSGGHIFMPKVGSRLENYYKHKLRGIPEKFGVWGCVGCGRCVSTCPVGIDIRKSIKELTGEEDA